MVLKHKQALGKDGDPNPQSMRTPFGPLSEANGGGNPSKEKFYFVSFVYTFC